MRIREELTLREMAGEQVVIMPGHYGADMTRVLALNETSRYLWEELRGRDFTENQAVELLTTRFEVDGATARRDAAEWLAKLAQYGALIE